jgi:hypothetical protein
MREKRRLARALRQDQPRLREAREDVSRDLLLEIAEDERLAVVQDRDARVDPEVLERERLSRRGRGSV